jgi:hypothetical protein
MRAGQRFIKIRAHAGASEHVDRSYGKPLRLGVREALRRDQQELPEAHRFQRARRSADIAGVRGFAQHYPDVFENIGGHSLRIQPFDCSTGHGSPINASDAQHRRQGRAPRRQYHQPRQPQS